MSDWYVAPALEALWGQVRATWPNRNTASDGAIGDAAHARTESDHNPDKDTGVVRALDLTATAAQARRILDATVGDPRVAYVIYDRRIWTPARGWYDYTGDNPHTNHVHVSLVHDVDAENDRTPWKGLEMARMKPLIGPGYISSAYGPRGGYIHAGTDYRPTAGYGSPVYATYAGTVERVVSTRVHDRNLSQPLNAGKPVLAAGRTGNGVRILNPDGERQLYGHVKPAVRVGQKVKAGDLLGYVDNSGNTSGPHVHFEIWNANSTTRNPQIDFTYHGVDPFSAKAAPKPPAPKPKPKPKPGKPGSRLTPKEVGNVQRALAYMGYDVGPDDEDYGDRTTREVMNYQRDLNHYAGAGLVEDGDWWTVVQNWFDWVKQLQRVLPAYKGVPKLRVDGGYQSLTHNAVKTLQRRNGLHPDGKAQAKTCAFMRSQGSNIPNPPKNRP